MGLNGGHDGAGAERTKCRGGLCSGTVDPEPPRIRNGGCLTHRAWQSASVGARGPALHDGAMEEPSGERGSEQRGDRRRPG